MTQTAEGEIYYVNEVTSETSWTAPNMSLGNAVLRAQQEDGTFMVYQEATHEWIFAEDSR